MKTKIYILVLCGVMILLSNTNTFGQGATWEWAKGAGSSSGGETGTSIAADAFGNCYVTGTFDGTSVAFGSITLTNSGSNDFFIVKYNTSGVAQWAQSGGGNGEDYATGITVDANGNSIITGRFNSSTMTFGSTTLTNAGIYDVFIVKYDASGNVLWAKSAGGSNEDGSNSITTDVNGNIYMTGYFNSGTITFGSTMLTNSGSSDIFIAKYDSSGNVLWANSAGGSDIDYSNGIAADANGNSHITGYFYSTTMVFGSTILTNTGGDDIFVAKYDPSGTLVWAKNAGGNLDDVSKSISVDGNGNSYISGYFLSSSIVFGSTTISDVGGGSDVFIAKFDLSGNAVWASSAGGTGDDGSTSIISDINGDSYITGYFRSGTITFGSSVLGNGNVTNPSYDVFIVKYDVSGNVAWAEKAGGTFGDVGNGIALDGIGDSYITGYFKSPHIDFGGTALTNAGGNLSDFFAAKLDIVTGIEEKNNALSTLNIFPDPATDKLTLSITMQSAANVTLIFYNTSGEQILQKNIKLKSGLNKDQVNIKDLAQGVYVAEIKNDSGILVKRSFVKE